VQYLCELGAAHPELGINPAEAFLQAVEWECWVTATFLYNHPAVDLSCLLFMDPPPSEFILEVVRTVVAERARWSQTRAAWVGVVVAEPKVLV